MAALLTLIDIDEAITNLEYKNKGTLKHRLICAIRCRYENNDTAESIQHIDTEELARELWCIGNGPESVKGKKKNLSNVKSSVNADFKRLYQEGRNPQGVIIGQNNLFEMSDEAKDRVLEKIADVLKEKSTISLEKITEVLGTVNDILTENHIQSGSEAVTSMKRLLVDLSRKIGFSLHGDSDLQSDRATPPAAFHGDQHEMGAIGAVGSTEGEGQGVAVADGAVDTYQNYRQDNERDAEVEIIEEDDFVFDSKADCEVIPEQTLEEESLIEEELEEKELEAESTENSAEVATSDEVKEEEVLAEESFGKEGSGKSVHEGGTEENKTGAIVPGDADSEHVVPGIPVSEGEQEEETDLEIVELEADDALQEDESHKAPNPEDDFYEKAEHLTALAEAAKVLERMGPGLDHDIFTEEEIREKAKFLSEEFDRDLSVREKYFHQHILIRGGEYFIGGANGGKCELPSKKASVSDFYIGKFPVTNALFEIFVDKTGYMTMAERRGYGYVYIPRTQRTKDIATGMETFHWSTNLQYIKVQGACWHRPHGPGSSLYNKRRHPVVQVSIEDACAFAAWTGKRIPTEKEWEAAARTPKGFIYPWGNKWRNNASNIEQSYCGDTTAVDKYLEYANDAGVVDLLGNVLEWTLDTWRPRPETENTIVMALVKGGSWISDSSVTLSHRFPMDKNTTSNILGFRCVVI